MAIGYAIAGLQLGMQATIPKNTRSFGTITGFITHEEQHTDTLEISEHPIEQGGVIADHAYKMPAKVTMKIGFSNSGPGHVASGDFSSAFLGQNVEQVSQIYGVILDMQAKRELFEVVTGKRFYWNMLIKEVMLRTEPKSEQALDLTVTFQEVLLTNSTTIMTNTIPASAQAQPQATQGTQPTGSRSLAQPGTLNQSAANAAINPTGG